MTRRDEGAGPRHASGVGPGAARKRVADPLRCGGRASQPGAAWSSVKINDDVESLASQAARQRHVVQHTPNTTWALCHDDPVDVGIVTNHWFSGAFDQIRKARIRIVPPQCGDRRCREHDVADQAKPDEQYPRRQGSTVASSINITGMSSLIG